MQPPSGSWLQEMKKHPSNYVHVPIQTEATGLLKGVFVKDQKLERDIVRKGWKPGFKKGLWV